MKKKKALITGISGQDGAYLSKYLLSKGYEVHGTARDAQISPFLNLKYLGVFQSIEFHSMILNDFRSVLQVLSRVQPDEIYNLAGQSSVGFSFEQPVETLESISIGTLYLLEAIRLSPGSIKFYSAGSSECFGDTGYHPADVNTIFVPRSPYAVAKSAAFWLVSNYRESYGLYACTGILFNHESPLRPERFVTQKIVRAACRIASGSDEKLYLGNIDISRDWGSAEEYVDAMWRMLQLPKPEDFVIATGETNTLRDFVAAVFEAVHLDWQDHVISDASLLRPSEIMVSLGNPTLAQAKLGWQAGRKMRDVVSWLISAELSRG